MSVSIWVGRSYRLIGRASFFKSFFSTIVVHLEGGKWGSRFPVTMNELYMGLVRQPRVATGWTELTAVRIELASFSPQEVIWDFEDRTAAPPWGTQISSHITSLANYYVTADGKDLFEVLISAYADATRLGQDVRIE